MVESMKPSLRKMHRRIWMALSVILLLLFIVGYGAIPREEIINDQIFLSIDEID